MSVRAPGYYTSWLHVVTDIPNRTNLNLYDFIREFTREKYGYEWTNTGKKLNAILTIKRGTVINAANFDSPKLNSQITGQQVPAALTIPNDFRDYDRITIINEGVIRGAYGLRDYSGVGSFTPPIEQSVSGVITNFEVRTVNLDVKAGGGDGAAAIGQGSGAGGGGGGAGGRCTKNNLTVTPGEQIVGATTVGRLAEAKYTQFGRAICHASPGASGQQGQATGKSRYCGGFDAYGIVCFNWFDFYNPGSPGIGGAGGRDEIDGVLNGQRGQNGQVGRQKYNRDNRPLEGCGGVGGKLYGGDGGDGGSEPGNPGCPRRSNGQGGYCEFSYTRRELFGPAVKNFHNNIRFINNGIIAGGINDNISDIKAFCGVLTGPSYPDNAFTLPSNGFIPSNIGFTSNLC